METFIDPNGIQAKEVPLELRKQALEQGKIIKKIVWDKNNGAPKESWGYTQYSLRPFQLGQGCDGTTDCNIHWLAINLCEQIGLDYYELYEEAYDEMSDQDRSWLRRYNFDNIINETEFPEIITDRHLRLLLSDLEAINNRSICDLLCEKLENLGHDVGRYWDNTKEKDFDNEMEVLAA